MAGSDALRKVRLLDELAAKLWFGSDARYFWEGAFPSEPYVAFYERIMERIGASESLKSQVYRGNVQKLFGLDAK